MIRWLRRRDRMKTEAAKQQGEKLVDHAEQQLQIQKAKTEQAKPIRQRLEDVYRRNHIAATIARNLREGGR